MSDAYDKVGELLRSTPDFSGIAAVHRDGTPEFEGCHGLANKADGVPVTPRTRFALASISKTFTAATVATLVRDGRTGFDTPVVEVLPPERRPATLRPDVTVAHLLEHTSAIADYAEEDDEFGEVDYATLWVDRPVAAMLRPADFLPMFGDLPPHGPPGRTWHYSNAGYVVLALVVEELTGLPFPDAVGERVFGPAGMAASGYFRTDDVRPDVAVGYLERGGPDEPWRTNVHATPVIGGGDGGAYSTAADLDRFLRAFGDGTLFGDAVRDEMLRPRHEVEDGPVPVHGARGVYLFDGCFGHDGGDPGAAGIVQHTLEGDVTVSVLCNVPTAVNAVRSALLSAVRGS